LLLQALLRAVRIKPLVARSRNINPLSGATYVDSSLLGQRMVHESKPWAVVTASSHACFDPKYIPIQLFGSRSVNGTSFPTGRRGLNNMLDASLPARCDVVPSVLLLHFWVREDGRDINDTSAALSGGEDGLRVGKVARKDRCTQGFELGSSF